MVVILPKVPSVEQEGVEGPLVPPLPAKLLLVNLEGNF